MENTYAQEHERDVQEQIKFLVLKSIKDDMPYETEIVMGLVTEDNSYVKHTTTLETYVYNNSYVCNRIESLEDISLDEFLDIVKEVNNGCRDVDSKNS